MSDAGENDKPRWFKSWLEPVVVITVVTASLSIGGLYARVSTLETAVADEKLYGQRIAAMESTLIHIDHQLDEMQRKEDTKR